MLLTVMDVVIDIIDQLIYIENNEVFVEVVKLPKMNRSFNFCYYTDKVQ